MNSSLKKIVLDKDFYLYIGIMSKACTECKVVKPFTDFSKHKTTRDNLQCACKACFKLRQHQTYVEKKTEINVRNNAHYANNKDAVRVKHAEYFQQNKEKVNLRIKQRLDTDPQFKICRNMRRRLVQVIETKGKTKFLSDALGCTWEQFQAYLESQFSPEMTWTNHGTYWVVDHIVPCVFFDHTKENQRKACWHYTNFQPLESMANIKKSGSLVAVLPVFVNDE